MAEHSDPTGRALLAFTVDPASEIGKKVQVLLQQGVVVGNPTSDVLVVPGNIGQYQTFENGVIVYSEPFGAVYLPPTIFNEWLALQGVINGSGEDLFKVVRLPVRDAEHVAHPAGYTVDMVSFEGGRIIVEPGQPIHLIYGPIYYRYLQIEANSQASPPQGLPLGQPRDIERPVFSGGEWGRTQRFEFGEIFWKRTLNSEGVVMYFQQTHGAQAFPQIYAYFVARGGPGNVLGFPLATPEILFAPADANRITPIGLVGRFENGSAYHNLATGATHVVSGAILGAYESSPTDPSMGAGLTRPHWLGFPISDQGETPGGKRFNDFEYGVIVSYAPNPSEPEQRNTLAFGPLEVFLQRIEGFGCDGLVCSAGDVDLWYNTRVWDPTGLILDLEANPDEWWDEPNLQVPATAAARSDFSVSVQIDAWDLDTPPHDYLGSTRALYNIENLWGAFEPVQRSCDGFDPAGGGDTQTCECFGIDACDPDHPDRTYPGDASQVWLALRHNLPLTGSYLADYNWSFPNSWGPLYAPMGDFQTFRSTFQDVSNAIGGPERWVQAGIHNLFFLAYQESLDPVNKGACFGMNVEATYAKQRASVFSLPLTQVGPSQTTAKGLIDIKHGYQWGLDGLLHSLATAGMPAFAANALSYTYWAAGEDPQISIQEDLFSYGHAVRPYRWEWTDASRCPITNVPCSLLAVADPNRPLQSGQTCPRPEDCAADPAACPTGCQATFEFDSVLQSFGFKDSQGVEHVGSMQPLGFLGARAIVLPHSLYDHPQYTPFANPLELAAHVLTILFGGYSQAHQISDDQGRSLFKSGTNPAHKRWADVRGPEDPERLNMIPVPGTSSQDQKAPYELYFGRAEGGSQTYEAGPDATLPPGTPYQVGFHSGKLAAVATIPGTPGQVERLHAYDMNTSDPGFGISLPAGAAPKAVSIEVSGVDKYRSITVSNLNLVASQTFEMRLEKAGHVLVYENDGPPTSADVTVKGGANVPSFALGTLELHTGEGRIDFQNPRTTLTVSGEVPGNAGWLLAPVTVALEAFDFSGSGIATIEWSLDGQTFVPYSGPFSYAEEGMTTLYYRARDNQFNQEETRAQSFKIDTREPIASGTVTTSGGVGLTYVVSDPVPGSGALGVFVNVQGTGGPVTVFGAGATGAIVLPTQCSAVEYWGVDVAGNEQAPHVIAPDSVAPVFTFVPPNIQTTQCTNLNIGLATATDDCSAVTITNNAPAKFPLGTTTVTWTARDATGNTRTATQLVTAILGDDPSCCPNGTNIILGNNNANTLVGTTGSDCVLLRGGNDTLNSFGGNDFVSGGAGNDTITTGNGNDYLNGGAGTDTCYALVGTDTVLNCEVSP